ncbi:MAG TPA: polysaccharide biosynthesis tyrosine autokinase [Opitutaceae bacterium]|nr:polysaccharide biosynthesis tyrosine autokinase [Opitutaceae bacterium]
MASLLDTKDNASLAGFLHLLRLRRALIVLVLGLVLVTTLGVTALLPRWYESVTQIRVERPEGEVKLYQAQSNPYYDPSFIQDQVATIQSKEILDQVIDNLGLNALLGRQDNNGEPLPTSLTYRRLVDEMVRVDPRRSSSIIDIGVYARDPALAARIANEIARVYSENRIAFATSGQREGVDELKKQLAAQEEIVSRQRDLVEKLRKDLNISGVDLNAHYSDMEIDRLRQMQNSLIALRVDAIGRKTRWERFKSIPFEQRLTLVNSELIQDTNIQNLLQAYLVADQNVTKLRARLGAAHPDLIAAIDSRAKIREQLDGLLEGYEKSLEISSKEADARVTELEEQLAKAKVDQILSARERLRPFEEAAQKLDDETRLLTTFKLTLRQREIDFQVPKRTIEILNDAEPAHRPSRPSWVLNIFFALVFGSVLGVGTAVLIEYFDTSFRNVADVEGRLQLPVLSVIPVSRTPAQAADDNPAENEPFRVLQTNLNLALPPGRPASLVVLSAGPGEGKSMVVHRLVHAMAAAGERVLLVDSDVRRPVQHRLEHRPREPGVVDILLNQKAVDEVVHRAVAPGLDVVTSGSGANFVLSLLYSNRLRDFIAQAKTRYDKVVFDSPPIIGVSDASVLASVVDGAVLLIQHRRNPQSMVLRARQIIDGLKTPILGVVLNQVPVGSGDDYDYYTQNYAYYGEDGKRRTRARKGAGGKGTSDHAPGGAERLHLDEPDAGGRKS